MQTLTIRLGILLALAVSSTVLGAESAAPPPPLPQATPAKPRAVAPAATPAVAPAAPSAVSVPANGPRIQCAAPVFDFGKVAAGAVVKHEFVFTNAGEQVLQVTEVRPGCGCTTAGTWSRQVEPGKTGVIPVEFNSANFNGPIDKAVTVTCNDPTRPTLQLQIKGNVWRPIEVTPQSAYLRYDPDSPTNAPATVRIVSQLPGPITLSPPKSDRPEFAAELTPVQPGREYVLTVKLVQPLAAANANGKITMETSSPELPVLTVAAFAIAQPALFVTPTQIVLPAAASTAKTTRTVSIRSTGSHQLALMDPTVNAKDVELQMREVSPGKLFAIAVTFPPGFEVTPEAKLELTVKSNHPKYPVVRTPILRQAGFTPPTGAPQAVLPSVPNRPLTLPSQAPKRAPVPPPPVPETPTR